MILEIVITQVKEGQEEAFEVAFKEATKLVVTAKGFIANELQRCIETKGRYVHMIRWESVDDHMVGFRGSPEFQKFREMLAPFYAAPSHMEHYEMVLKNPS
ncbi:MAG: antibiotic biosynthesis monooxygenase family protein [Anaerolineae bacterium]